MTHKIQLLSEATINKIAAGEVIENPSSIVKELVENALDADATKIVVELIGGGLHSIRISDDGCGMSKEDAVLSIQRHATSKIREAEDLFCVDTMGFRGEALASIAAIAKMSIETAEDSHSGTKLLIEAGSLLSLEPCARSKGTTFFIRQLFYNVPARKKFQKSPAACAAEVTKVLTQISLAHPHVCFELYQQDKQVFSFPSCGEKEGALLQRVQDALGQDFVEGSKQVQGEGGIVSFQGVIGSCHNTRPNRSCQYLFINKRPVTSPIVSFAVKQALGTRIPENRYPIFVLFLQIPHAYIDVNVHPQKKEVRIREESFLKEVLIREIDKAFSPHTPRPIAPLAVLGEEHFFSQKPPEKDLQPAVSLPFVQTTFFEPHKPRPIIMGVFSHFLWVEARSLDIEGLSKEGLVVIDLEAATARLLYHALCWKKMRREQQMLLLPLTLPCSMQELEQLSACVEELSSMGFSLQRNRSSFLIEAIPACMDEEEALAYVRDFLCFSAEEKQQQSYRAAKACARLASLRKEGHTVFSAEALLQELLRTPDPLLCPLGKKIMVPLGKDAIQQLFVNRK